MTVIFERAIDGPATHALVIGVGSYPYATPASGSDYQVAPLRSAPESARRFCDWLIARQDKLGPKLASVRLLLADPRAPNGATYAVSATDTIAVDGCDLDTISSEFDAWYEVVNQPEASSLFFFSGHGFYNGRVYGLAEDFARSANNPFAKVISFNEFYETMAQCAAYQQLFFIDCCQGLSDDAIDTYDGVKGSSLLQPVPSALQARVANHGNRGAYRVFATSPGVETQGDPDGISDFTTILLDCLNGRAAEKLRSGWWVTTKNLQEGLEACAEEHGWAHLESPDVRGNKTLRQLHQLDGPPDIPVRVVCEPSGATRRAHLVITDASGAVVLDDPPKFRVTSLGLFPAARDYELQALFQEADGFDNGLTRFDIIPPVVQVEVETPQRTTPGRQP